MKNNYTFSVFSNFTANAKKDDLLHVFPLGTKKKKPIGNIH